MATLKLLTVGNPKTAKGASLGFWTFILHLAPAKLSGFQTCPMATEGCRNACLNTAGRGGMAKGKGRLTVSEIETGTRTNTIQAARIRKTRAFFEDRETFMDTLRADIQKAIAMADKAGFKAVFRLNGTSDIRWESVRETQWGGKNIFEIFPDVQFYDYTKLANRRGIPANYRLTFSLADGNDVQAFAALANGYNVAVVFRKAGMIPSEFMGRPTFNGDETDLRFMDPKGVIVALYAKGNAKRDTSGFVRDV
jgi:hypothetical protein